MTKPHAYLLHTCALTTMDPINYNAKLWCHSRTVQKAVAEMHLTQSEESIDELMRFFYSWALDRRYEPGQTVPVDLYVDDKNSVPVFFNYTKAPFLPKTYMFEVENTMIRSTMGYLRAQTPMADDCLRKLDHIGIQKLVTTKWQQVRSLHESNQPSVGQPETLLLEGAIHTHLPVDYWFDDHTQLRLNPPDEKPARSR